MNCRSVLDRVDEFLDALLDPEDAAGVRAHIASCPECTREVRSAERFRAFLAGSGHDAIESAASRRVAERARVDGARTAEQAPRGRRLAIRVAAAAAVAVAAFAGWSAAPRDAEPVPTLAEGAPVRVARGAERVAAPGCRLLVDDDALLAVAPGSEGQRVRLDAGSAMFQVEHGKPFAVETPQGDVHVLGTLFHVEARSDGSVTVAVLSGVVRFDPRRAQPRRTLRAGTLLDVDPEGRQRVVSRAQTSDLETRVGMQDFELGALRGEVQRLEEALAAVRVPVVSAEPPVPVTAADSAGVPWHELGVAARRLLEAGEGFDDPEAMVAFSVFLAHAPKLKRITGGAHQFEWPLHPIVLSRAAPSFFESLAPESSSDGRAAVAALVAAAGEAYATRLADDPTPTEALAEKLRFFRTLVDGTRTHLGDEPAAAIARALERTRDGAPVRIVPVGTDPAAEFAREWGRSMELDAEQALAAAPAFRSYVDAAFAAQQTVLATLGTSEAEPLLFPEFRPWRRRPVTAAVEEPGSEAIEKALRRIDAKLQLAKPRIELERAVAALLRPDQARRGYLGGSVGWGLPTLRSHD